MEMFSEIWPAIWLTLQLAFFSTLILMIMSVPLAWWLTVSTRRFKPLIEALVTLPLVLPPTVIGFYLLILMSPNAFLGGAWMSITGETLAFSFAGLLLASVIYSLPFAIQPLRGAFETIGSSHREVAATLGASPIQAFFSVVLPLSRRGLLSAAVLSFAHTLGEFGIVLMVGGNIPGRTRVISIEIFNRVETLDYEVAHLLSAGLLIVSFLALTVTYFLGRERRR